MEYKNLFIAINAALKAGKAILTIYNDPSQNFGVEKKTDNSPLTIADKKAHELIASDLETTAYPILSEEGRSMSYDERKSWTRLWIVDPLDGTKEFIKKNGEFTVNIALVDKSTPILGVIYVPVKKELYFSCEQLGSYKVCNIDTLQNSKGIEALLQNAIKLPIKSAHLPYTIVASRSHLSNETELYINEIRKEHGEIEMISSGSSIKICLVAEGRADLYPRFAPTMEWDTAAGHAIARAAGMEIYQVGSDRPLEYNKEDLLNPWFIVEKKRNLI